MNQIYSEISLNFMFLTFRWQWVLQGWKLCSSYQCIHSSHRTGWLNTIVSFNWRKLVCYHTLSQSQTVCYLSLLSSVQKRSSKNSSQNTSPSHIWYQLVVRRKALRERLKRFLEELLRYKDYELTIFANHPKINLPRSQKKFKDKNKTSSPKY